jgi:hypothetical protein
MADLTQSITYRGVEINSASVTYGKIIGCLIDQIDYSEVEVRQFTEPLALANGLDVGGVWLGARQVRIAGTVYDTTRAACGGRIDVLEALFGPTAVFEVDPTSFGFAPLVFRSISGYVRTLYARSNGLRVTYNRDQFGGNYNDPLAIPWTVTMLAKNPAIT